MAGQDWTFWFNMTNFALGMITILAVVVVFAAVGWDLFALWLHHARKTDSVDVRNINLGNITADLLAHWHDEPHSLAVPGLGLTMADGGERVDPSKNEPSNNPSEPASSEEKSARK